MFTFFRKIRKSLIDSGSARRYFFYAIGEIALVVIGILIALQINNWNETQKTKYQVNDQLQALTEALQDDMDSFKESLGINQFRYASFLYLLRIGGHATPYEDFDKRSPTWIWQGDFPETYDKEFIKLSFSWFHRGYGGIVINRSSINEMNNTGIFSQITDAQLKNSINEYYNFINWRFGQRDMELRYRSNDELVKYIQDKYDIWTSDISTFAEPLNLLREDQGLIVRLRSVIRETHWHCLSTISIIEKAEKLIKEIEAYTTN